MQAFTERHVPTVPPVSSRDEWEKFARTTREHVLRHVVYRGEAAEWRDAAGGVEWLETIEEDHGYRIKKLRYEAVPGMWIPALLYEPTKLEGKVPVILNVNGHDRTDGKAADYKQMRCINQAKRGMLALNVEWLGMGQLNASGYDHGAMNQLDLCGTSGLAPFYLSMVRGLDVLLAHEHADPQRVAVAGLSGGGWQTIVISSLDTRVTLSNPVAGYSSFLTRARHFKDLGDSEQTPNDLAVYADYTHLTAMLAPRTALLTYNESDDCCFESPSALPPLLDAARPIYQLYGAPDRLHSHVNSNPGTHNFEQDNREALYRMIRDQFYPGSTAFDVGELAVDAELKTKDELHVPIPENNTTFNTLALQLSRSLPRDAQLPQDRPVAERWQEQARAALHELVRSHLDAYECTAEQQDSFTRDNVRITYWRCKVGGDWTVPAVEFAPRDATDIAIVVSDEGRMKSAAAVHEQLASGRRVLAVDPFYFGEARISQKDYLFALLVAAVGRRPLGIQANQIAAIARWARESYEQQEVTLIAHGPRSCTMSLVAAGIDPQNVSAVHLHGAMGSLKEVIEKNQTVNVTPELFCFGLLERFDMLQLAALVAPRPVTIHSPSDRARTEFQPLSSWYETLGNSHDPLND